MQTSYQTSFKCMKLLNLLIMKIFLKDVCGDNIKKEKMLLNHHFNPLFYAVVVNTDVLMYHFCFYFHGDNVAHNLKYLTTLINSAIFTHRMKEKAFQKAKPIIKLHSYDKITFFQNG